MDGTRIGSIGGGNMARAIIEGCDRAGVVPASAWVIADPNPDAQRACADLGANATGELSLMLDAIDSQSPVLLAVKPQQLAGVAEQAPSGHGFGLVVSILAGTPSERVARLLPGPPRVVRAMPNMPAQIGLGVTAISAGPGATDSDLAWAEHLFRGIGPLVERIDENLMDAFTGIAGSGPAYLFYLAEAMASGAERVGFEADVADRIVRATLHGAAALLRQSDQSPAELRRRVTSKGGTTAAAIEVLERCGMHSAMIDAIVAARDRGRSLGAG